MTSVKPYIEFLLLVVLLVSTVKPSFTQTSDSEYANWLFERGFYLEARSEYLRLYHRAILTNQYSINSLNIRIAETYLLSDQIGEGINWCQSLEKELPGKFEPNLKIIYSLLFMQSGRFDQGCVVLSDERFMGLEEENRVSFLLGCCNANLWRLDNAIHNWKKIPEDHQYFSMAKEYINLTNDAKTIKLKKPSAALLLSLFPGGGYLYAGHNKTALSALVVIGLTSWGTYASFNNEIQGIGYLTGFLTIGWYGGSIYGSYLACERWNVYQKESYISNINF